MLKQQQEKIIEKQKTKKMLRKERWLKKEQEKDFQRYGIKPGEIEYQQSANIKKTYKPLFNCLKYIKEYRWHIIGLVIFSIFYAALTSGFPLFTQMMADSIYAGDINQALMFLLLYCALSLVGVGLDWIWQLSSNYVIINSSRKLQNRLVQDLTCTQIKKFDSANSGAIINRVNNDTNSLTSSIFDTINYLFMAISGLGYIAIFFVANVWLGCFMIVAMLVYTIFDNFYQKINYLYGKKATYLSDKTIGITTEIVRGVRDVKLLNIASTIKKRHSALIDKMTLAKRNKAKASAATSNIREIVWNVCRFCCIGFAFWLFASGQMGVGGLIICLFYAGCSLDTISFFSQIRTLLKSSLVCAERIDEVMSDQYPKETFGTKTLTNPQGKIQFKNVKFAYTDDKKLFEDLNLQILPNECVGFVGKSGQGKSTIINLISKLYDIQGGQILIDDIPIDELTEDSLRSNICVVPQSPYIFNMSIKENLLLTKPDASMEEIRQVCKSAFLDEFIQNLPKQYDTEVGEGGVQLSGGQKQRLAIARALLAKSKIILFDEATSALDNESQEKIKMAIADIKKTKTILIVAHRLTTVQDCDKIFVVSNNQISACGTHKQLMKSCPEYIALYKNKEENNQE